MKKYLGIWYNKLGVTVSTLKSEGFNALFITTTWRADDDMFSYTERLLCAYDYAKSIGFKFFYIDYGQGQGKVENPPNYNYRIVYDAFKDFDDVVFYMGEPIEAFIERLKCKRDLFYQELYKKIEYAEERILVDGTKRNVDELIKLRTKYPNIRIAVSSYWRQQTKWAGTTNVWITGQLGYHIFSSWCFRSLAKLAKDKDMVCLYQGNPADKSSDGIENYLYEKFWDNVKKIREFFGAKNAPTGRTKRLRLEAERRKLFIKEFGK